MSTHNYYIYAFTDPRKPGIFQYKNLTFNYEPFYIGKGKGSRATRHFNKSYIERKTNSIKEGKIKKIIESGYNLLDYCVILYSNLNETDAFEKEIQTIQAIGRINLNQGPLSNLTNGGEGMSGHINKNKGKTYEEIYGKEKAQLLKKEKSKRFSGKNNPMYGKLAKGRKCPEKIKKYLSEIRKKPIYQICKKTNKIINKFDCAESAAKYLNIGKSGIHNCLSPNNPSKSSGGFYWAYVENIENN